MRRMTLILLALVLCAGQAWGETTTAPRRLVQYTGYTRELDVDYDTARSAASADTWSNSDYYVGQRDDVYIYRTFLSFDVSDIPAGAIATSCDLYVYGEHNFSTTDFTWYAVSSYQDNGSIGTDWHNDFVGWTSGTGAYSTINYTEGYSTASFTFGWMSTSFTEAGLDSLESYFGSEIFKLAILSGNDISGTAPTTDEFIGFYVDTNIPYLSIEYSLPAATAARSTLMSAGSPTPLIQAGSPVPLRRP